MAFPNLPSVPNLPTASTLPQTSDPSSTYLPPMSRTKSTAGSIVNPDDACTGGIVDAATYGTDAAKYLYYVRTAMKLYSDDCKKRNALALLGLDRAMGPKELLQKSVQEAITSTTAKSIAKTAMQQIGERAVYTKSREQAAKILDNVKQNSKVNSIVKKTQNVSKTVFTLAAMSMTAGNDIILGLARLTAAKLLELIAEKQDLVIRMRDDLRRINNALLILDVKDFRDEYKELMLKARNYLFDSRVKFVEVEGTLLRNRGFLNTKYQKGKISLDKADEILTPKQTDSSLNGKLNNQGLLWNGVYEGVLGVSANEEQKAAAYSLPQLTQNMTKYIDTYISLTERINTMLRNYINAFANLKKASGGKLTEHEARMLQSAIDGITEVIDSMDKDLNNDNPSIGYSLKSFEWFTQVKTIKSTLELMRPDALDLLDKSNETLMLYNESVRQIKSIDTLSTMGGRIVLDCKYGQEDYSDMILQLGAMVIHAEAIFLFNKSIRNLKDIVVILDAKLKLVQNLLAMLKNDLLIFKNTENPTVTSMVGMLDTLGLDRAKDFLVSGNYGKFFALTDRTATYAGAAMTCLRQAGKCAKNQQTKNQIDELMLVLQRHEKNKYLEASRSIDSGRQRQKNRILEQLNECEQLKGKADKISSEPGCDTQAEDASYLSDNEMPTTNMVSPQGGFDIKDPTTYAESPYSRQQIIDSEIQDFDTMLDLTPLDNLVLSVYDRDSEIPIIDRTIQGIQDNMSKPPLPIEIDQLTLNQNLKDSLIDHSKKRKQVESLLSLNGVQSGVESLSVENGVIVRAYKLGRLIYERSTTSVGTSGKVILAGNF